MTIRAGGLLLWLMSPVSATTTAPTRTPRLPPTAFAYESSDPEEHLGKGMSDVLTPLYDGPVQVRHYAPGKFGSVTVEFGDTSKGNHWQLGFWAPEGSDLTPGTYENAIGELSGPELPHDRPGLTIVGPHYASCYVYEGRFVVSEAVYFSPYSDEVQSLAIDFEVHCDHDWPVFYGLVRINSLVPPLMHSPTPVPPTPALHSEVFAYESDLDDTHLGFADARVLTEADAEFTATHEPGLLAVHVQSVFFMNEFWDLYFRAPLGGELLPGAYEDVTNTPWERRAGIAVSGRFRDCNFEEGRFVIWDAAYTPSGDVERPALDFELRCDNTDPLFFGYLRLHTNIAPPAERTPTPTPPADQFVLRIDSDPGDPVGYGRKFTLDRTQATAYGRYSRIGTEEAVEFTIYMDDKFWSLLFIPPLCSDLAPGVYADALQAPGAYPANPQLDVTDNFQGRCSAGLLGQFTIREVQLSENRDLYRFVADFEQRCTNATGSLRGSISYTSIRPTPTPQPPTPTPTDYSSMAVLYSELGDFIGGCKNHYFTLANGDFTASYADGHVSITYAGAQSAWSFDFAAPAGEDLVPGTYPNAVRYGTFRAPDEPGLSIAGESRGCSDLTGQFTVLESAFGTGGKVEHFAADFAQFCDGVEPPLYGTVRFHSSLPPATFAPANPPTPTPARGPCWGDCSADGRVTVDDIVRAVTIALGEASVIGCPAADTNHDGEITVAELTTSVGVLLAGCDPNDHGRDM